jgi:hypothetical protein
MILAVGPQGKMVIKEKKNPILLKIPLIFFKNSSFRSHSIREISVFLEISLRVIAGL